jgi:5-(carboxyamino)imidazole ribonucleotide synthase
MQSRSLKSIGIVGGGQLGRMTILEARKMDIQVYVLTPEHPSPASDIADGYIVGSLYDSEKIRELSGLCDVLSFEIEHIDVDTLKEIEATGKKVAPSSHVLEIIQDKSLQKQLFRDHGLRVSDWEHISDQNRDQLIERFGFPVVQKSRKGGYDGKGVFVLNGSEDISRMIDAPSFFEEFIPFEKEVAVIVARNGLGEIRSYPMVEMQFNAETNICDITLVPSKEPLEIQRKAEDLALAAVEALDGQGVFGVEMFLTGGGELILNEVAPRPHNSGHYTIEGCFTSQYEQYIRAILDLPLGSTELVRPNVMTNLLGEAGCNGLVKVTGLEEAMKIPGVNIHIYGKRQTKPHRKMGHVTALADNVDEALKNAQDAQKLIKIIAEE